MVNIRKRVLGILQDCSGHILSIYLSNCLFIFVHYYLSLSFFIYSYCLCKMFSSFCSVSFLISQMFPRVPLMWCSYVHSSLFYAVILCLMILRSKPKRLRVFNSINCGFLCSCLVRLKGVGTIPILELLTNYSINIISSL